MLDGFESRFSMEVEAEVDEANSMVLGADAGEVELVMLVFAPWLSAVGELELNLLVNSWTTEVFNFSTMSWISDFSSLLSDDDWLKEDFFEARKGFISSSLAMEGLESCPPAFPVSSI